MDRRYLLLFIGFISFNLTAQDTYIVYFKQKDLSKGKVNLSKESIERRARYGVSIDERDYSISTDRRNAIQSISPILSESKWLNAVSVNATEKQIEAILKLPFVSAIDILKKESTLKSTSKKLESQYSVEQYGKSYQQISIHQGQLLHDAGYLGEGMKIAVFDAGFNDIDKISSFRHLFLENRIYPIKNLVYDSKNLYQYDGHGTNVMGCMSSFLRDTIVATAPHASYYLFITEDARSESRLEEYNWAVAAEIADSIGVDMIHSSLGYAEFDDPAQNYTRAQMDGKTAIVSKAAAIACEKGMIVVNSAGNLGNNPWRIISAPADVDNVISVGAIDIDKNIADFSSRGWNARNQVKPELVAVGRGTTLLYHNGNYSVGSGTSFSAPVLTGLIACFWQKNRHLRPDEMRPLIYSCATNYTSPTEDMGYGIPEFKRIMDVQYLSVNTKDISIYPNPTLKSTIVEINVLNAVDDSELSVYHAGKEIMKNKISLKKGLNQLFVNIESLSRGIYFVKVKLENSYIEGRFEKL